MAIEQGYLNVPAGVLASIGELRNIPLEKLVVITTGSQGEPTSALTRMANNDHQHIKIVEGDTVVLSASPIPGNEALIYRTVDNLFKLGAQVLYNRVADIHVRGHAAQEELKIILGLVRPRYFVPIHGEYRHMVLHARLAQDMGVPKERTFVMLDGDVLEIDDYEAEIVGRVPAEYVYVDGLGVGDISNVILRDRRHLSTDGMVVIIIPIDKRTGQVVGQPDVISRGFVDEVAQADLLNRAKSAVIDSLGGAEHIAEWGIINTTVKESIAKLLYAETRRRPMVLPVAVEI
jgi:ribonuclease J